MRLAFYTYSYTDRLQLPVADCLARIAATGYAGIDESGTFGPSEDPHSVIPERRQAIRETARQQGLSVEAVITHAELTTTLANRQPLDLSGTIDLAAELGGNAVTFHMGGSILDYPDEELWEDVLETLQKAARHAKPHGLSLLIDGIWPTWIVNSPAALSHLFDAVGEENFGVNFDPCYLALLGFDPVEFVHHFAARIRHAHLKDHVGRYPRWEHRIPGQGEMDYVRLFAALAESGFTGSMAVECFTNMPFEEACDRGYEAMSAALQQAGVA